MRRQRSGTLCLSLRDKVSPVRLVQIDLGPFGPASLARTRDLHRRQLECTEDRERPGKAIECPQHRADLCRLGDGSEVRGLSRRNRVDQVTSRIHLAVALLDPVTEYPADLAAYPVS